MGLGDDRHGRRREIGKNVYRHFNGDDSSADENRRRYGKNN
jgi:hypothetical protein